MTSDAPAILNEFDRRSEWMPAGKLRRWLASQCESYALSAPEDILGLAALYSELGVFEGRHGLPERAEESLIKAKTLLEGEVEADMPVSGSFAPEGEDERGSFRVSVNGAESVDYANVLMNLADLYMRTEREEDALAALCRAEEVLDLNAAVPDTIYAGCLNDKAALLLKRGDCEGAYSSLSKALEYICSNSRSAGMMAYTTMNLGYTMLGLGGKNEARECFERAAALFLTAENGEGKMYGRCRDMAAAISESAEGDGLGV